MPEDYLQELQQAEQAIESFGRRATIQTEKVGSSFKRMTETGKTVGSLALMFNPAGIAIESFSRHTIEASKSTKRLTDSLDALGKGTARARLEITKYRLLGDAMIGVGKGLQAIDRDSKLATTTLNKLGKTVNWVGESWFKKFYPNVEIATKATDKLMKSQYGLLRVMGQFGGNFAKVFLGPIGTGVAAASLSYDLFIKKATERSKELEDKLKGVVRAMEALEGQTGRLAGGRVGILAEAALLGEGVGRRTTLGILQRGVPAGFGLEQTGQLANIARVMAAQQGRALEPVLKEVFERAGRELFGTTMQQQQQMLLDWRLRAGPIRGPGIGIGGIVGRQLEDVGGIYRNIGDLFAREYRHFIERLAGPAYAGERRPLRTRIAEMLPGGYGRGILSGVSGILGRGAQRIFDFPTGALRRGEEAIRDLRMVGARTAMERPDLFVSPGRWLREMASRIPIIGGLIGPTRQERRPLTPEERLIQQQGTREAIGLGLPGIEERYRETVRRGGAAQARLNELLLIQRFRQTGGLERIGQADIARERFEALQRRIGERVPTRQELEQMRGFERQFRELSPEQLRAQQILRRTPGLSEVKDLTPEIERLRKVVKETADESGRIYESWRLTTDILKRPDLMRAPILEGMRRTPGDFLRGINEQVRQMENVQAEIRRLEREQRRLGGRLPEPEEAALRNFRARAEGIKAIIDAIRADFQSFTQDYQKLQSQIQRRERRVTVPALLRHDVGTLTRVGAITPGQERTYGRVIETYAATESEDLRKHFQKLLDLRKTAYDEEIKATSQVADMRIQIIREQNQSIIQLERARLQAPDRRDVFRIGYLRAAGAIEQERTGIRQTLRGVEQQRYARAIEEERFRRGQLTGVMGLSGIPMPQGLRMAFGMRELQLAQEERRRREEERVNKLLDAVEEFSNVMRTGRGVGLTPERLMQSEAGRAFYGQQLRRLLPAAAELGYGGSVAQRYREVLGRQQAYQFQMMQFGEQQRGIRLAGTGRALTALGEEFAGRQRTPEYLARRAALLKEQRDILAAQGRPEQAAMANKLFLDTYRQLSEEQKKAIVDKQEAIRLVIEGQKKIVKDIYDFLRGRGEGRRTAGDGGRREYGAIGDVYPGKGDPGALVGGPFHGVTSYKREEDVPFGRPAVSGSEVRFGFAAPAALKRLPLDTQMLRPRLDQGEFFDEQTLGGYLERQAWINRSVPTYEEMYGKRAEEMKQRDMMMRAFTPIARKWATMDFGIDPESAIGRDLRAMAGPEIDTQIPTSKDEPATLEETNTLLGEIRDGIRAGGKVQVTVAPGQTKTVGAGDGYG